MCPNAFSSVVSSVMAREVRIIIIGGTLYFYSYKHITDL